MHHMNLLTLTGFINDENAGSLFTDDLTQTFIASTRIANSVSQNAIRYQYILLDNNTGACNADLNDI